MFFQRPRRSAPLWRPGMHHLRSQNTAAGPKHRTRFNPRLIADTDLASDDGAGISVIHGYSGAQVAHFGVASDSSPTWSPDGKTIVNTTGPVLLATQVKHPKRAPEQLTASCDFCGEEQDVRRDAESHRCVACGRKFKLEGVGA